MKPIRFSKFSGHSRTLRSFRLALAAPALVLTLATAQAGTPAAPAAAEPASNWVSFTIGGAFVDGNNAGMMRRTQTNGDFYGGIDSMQLSQAIDKETTFTLDGHAMPGLEDYGVNLDLTKTGLGYVKAGFKQYRTWYDGTGGFLPGALYGATFGLPVGGDEQHLDRGEISFEAGLRMENLPEVTFTYKHLYRNGDKDSLAWGEGAPYALPSAIPPVAVPATANQYKLMPAAWNLDEKTDVFGLNIDHTIGITDLGMGLTYEHSSYSDTRTNTRGYDKTVTSPATTNANAYRIASQTDDYTMDLFAGNIHSTTRFSDNLWVSEGFAYSSVNTDTNGGSRSFSYPYSIYKGARGPDAFYQNMLGGAEVSQLVGNLNVMWVPCPDVTITPSVRYEHEDSNAWNQINSYTIVAPAAAVPYPAYSSDIEKDATTAAVDLRYTGVQDWVFYAKGQWGHEQETVMWSNLDPTTPSYLHNDNTVDEQEYTAGANWYAMSNLSFSMQGLYSERHQTLDPTAYNGGGTQTLRPIMVGHDTTLEDLNARINWRPLSNLSLVTRYDLSQTKYRVQGINWPGAPATLVSGSSFILPGIGSGETTSQIISESITWSPMTQLYLQATGAWVMSRTDSYFTGVTDSNSNYFSGSLAAGYAIDNKTDLTSSLNYYGAKNYDAAAGSMGYGLNTDEFAVNVTLTRMLTANMVWNLRYGYMTSNTSIQDQSGGFNDFAAHMVSTGLQIRF